MLTEPVQAMLVGLSGGIVLGLAARIGRFCTLGSIEDLLYGHDDRRIRLWAAALGVAMASTALVTLAGALDPQATVYLSAPWHPGAAAIGGLLFGYGMALAGNCGFSALARFGGGDFRAFVIVIVLGLGAYMTLSGPLAWLRVAMFPPDQGMEADLLGQITGGGPTRPLVLLLLGAGIAGLAASPLRHDRAGLGWSAAVGLAISGGWAGTAWIARTGFDATPIVSHTFSAPVGETMLYAMTATGNHLSFGIGSVLGVIAGSALGCLWHGHFRWEACDDPGELRRQVAGAFLMGVGAVVAMGCSIGQGLSAFSVLSASAPVTLGAIFVGAMIGLRHLIEGAEAF